MQDILKLTSPNSFSSSSYVLKVQQQEAYIYYKEN